VLIVEADRLTAAASWSGARAVYVERTLDMVGTKREPACAARFLSRLPETAVCSVPGSGNGHGGTNTGRAWREHPK